MSHTQTPIFLLPQVKRLPDQDVLFHLYPLWPRHQLHHHNPPGLWKHFLSSWIHWTCYMYCVSLWYPNRWTIQTVRVSHALFSFYSSHKSSMSKDISSVTITVSCEWSWDAWGRPSPVYPCCCSGQQTAVPEDTTALFGPPLETAFGDQKTEGNFHLHFLLFTFLEVRLRLSLWVYLVLEYLCYHL